MPNVYVVVVFNAMARSEAPGRTSLGVYGGTSKDIYIQDSVSPVVLSCLEGKVVIPPGGRNCQGRFNRVQTPTISLIPPGIHPPLSRPGS